MTEGEEILRAARAAGAAEAEVYLKSSRGRRVILEPGPAGGAPRITVSAFVDEGMALRVIDGRGRMGLSWCSPADVDGAGVLAASALAAAGRSVPDRRSSGSIPFAPPPDGALPDLGIDDPEIATASDDRLAGLLGEAVEAAAGGAEAEVDRCAVSAATTSLWLLNSLGFRGTCCRSLAHLSISMAPAVPGARAVLEERAACRLQDLDPLDCGVEAARRALPPRPLVPPPAGALPVILSPRAAASLLRALLPWILRQEPHDPAPEAGRAPGRIEGAVEHAGGLTVIDDARLRGRPGSAPFDGAGRATGRTILLSAGRPAGRLEAGRGNAVRASFRDPPVLGPSNLLVVPGHRLDPRVPRRDAGEVDGRDDIGDGPCLLIAAARFWASARAGIHVLRGDWRIPSGLSGPADGLYWSGPLETLIRGVVGAGSDLRFFHPGMPIGAPSLRIEGIGPWVARGVPARPAPGAAPRRLPRAPGGGDQAASGRDSARRSSTG